MPKIIVDKDLLLRVAENARLVLSESEIEEFLPQLKDVLDFFSVLDEVDVSSVEESFHPVLLENVFRSDSPKECLSQEEALSNSINNKDGYFKGPKVV